MTVVDCCMCNYGEKIPARKDKISWTGKTIGREYYCKKCGKQLSTKDIDLFAFELGLKD